MQGSTSLVERLEQDAGFYRERGDDRTANLLAYYANLARDYRERAELETLTTDQVAEAFNRSRDTIYRARKAGLLPAVKVGREWTFRRRDVVRWILGKPPLPESVTDALPT